jgi:asparagine synthase (glutamine-hydrolysing)
MCGIAGCIYPRHGSIDAAELIARMCQALRHRGPDDQGTWIEDGIALGARRLAIIDLVGGQQPVFNEDRNVVVVNNGEIYNYRELRRELQARGHRFRTESDTESIVHAYEEYGDECVQHLRGMFAFALWDHRRQRLLAARDRFGKKPLHYYWNGTVLVFGSEIKAILEADVPRIINPAALDEYLTYGYILTPHTLFQGITKLPAGHLLVYESGQVALRRYWELSFAPNCRDSEAVARERVRALLTEAVQIRLVSEVPLGAFLSGGIDSSLVVALMSRSMEQPVKTFSIGFEEDAYSELPYARQVARRFGTDHHEFVVRPDLVAVLPDLIQAYDEPFADSSMLPTYYVSKLAREHVTVVLTGDGGDELFGGYQRYRREMLFQHVPLPLRLLLGHGSRLLPDTVRGKKRLRNMLNDSITRYVQFTTLFSDEMRPSLYQQDYLAASLSDHLPYERLFREFRAVPTVDLMTRMQAVDVRTYLPDDILVKVDRASMFNSLETRAPLLDQKLAEYVASLPSSLRTRNNTLKYLLKRVASEMLPAEIVTRPKKGFSIPIDSWFRGELASYVCDMLLSQKAQQRGILNPAFIHHLLKAHTTSRLVNQSAAIWALLCLELWFQTYMDAPVGSGGRVM